MSVDVPSLMDVTLSTYYAIHLSSNQQHHIDNDGGDGEDEEDDGFGDNDDFNHNI